MCFEQSAAVRWQSCTAAAASSQLAEPWFALLPLALPLQLFVTGLQARAL
jgi:hypothetical protein